MVRMKNTSFIFRFLQVLLIFNTFIWTSASPAADWPVFRGPNHNGVSGETKWNPNFADPKPGFLWRNNVGTGFSIITVKNGKAYTSGNVNDKDVIHCFDSKTGKKIWRYFYPEKKNPKYYEGGPGSSITIKDGKAYSISKTGDVYCFDADSGKVIWEVNLQESYNYEPPKWGFSGSPFIMDEKVILNAGSAGIALDKNTGNAIWKSSAGVSGYATAVPFVNDGITSLLIFAKDSLVAIKPGTGKVLWSFPWQTRHDVNAADPIVNGNRIFISSGYNRGCCLLEINGTDVKKLWENKKMRNHFSSCVLLDGFLYGFDESTLKCMDFNTSEVMWEQKGLGKGTLISAAGKLIVLSESGKLITADATSKGFDPVSSAQILSGSRCWSMPVLVNGKVYARNADGDAVCVDAGSKNYTGSQETGKAKGKYNWCHWRGPDRDGISKEKGLLKKWPEKGPEMIWSYEGLGKGYASVSVCDGVVYVPGTIDETGYMHAFDTSGKLLWKKPYAEEWVRSFPGSRSTPAVNDGNVYVITGHGVVVCLSVSDGGKLWSEDIKSKYNGKSKSWGYASSPLIYKNMIIFSPGGPKAGIVALNKDDGSVIWESKSTGEGDAYCPPLVFEHAGRKILVTMMEESVWFVNPDTGELIYRDKFTEYQKKPKDINPNTPIYNNGYVFTSSGYDAGCAMYEISDDGSKISRKWTDEVLDTHHGGNILINGRIYGSNWKGNNNGDWICMNWDNGEILSTKHWHNKGSVIAADSMLYIYEEKDGNFALAEPTETGFDIVSSFKVTMGSDQHWAHPLICNGILYIRHGDALMAFDISSDQSS
jgi:outer membrane protein assembly factor BamB